MKIKCKKSFENQRKYFNRNQLLTLMAKNRVDQLNKTRNTKHH